MTAELSTLSAQETERLALLEVKVSMGLRSFIEVGDALAEIRDLRLYRASHTTFETYCRDRWRMTRTRAYQLIEATETMSTMVDKSAITSERQARELAKVEPAQREAVVAEAQKNTGGKITAAALKEAAQTIAPVIEMTPAPARAAKAATHEPAAKDSPNLAGLKNLWDRCGASERKAFLRWIEANP